MNRGVLALLDDLMFQVKIMEAAKRAEVEVLFLKDGSSLVSKAKETQPLGIIIDLNYAKGDPLGTIRSLQADEGTSAIPEVAYVSHVQTELRMAGLEAGCQRVLPRSAFVQNIHGILAEFVIPAETQVH